MIKVHIGPKRFAGTEIYITEERDGKIFLVKPVKLEFEEIDPSTIDQPTLSLSDSKGMEFLQGLSEALIKSGFRDKAISKDGEIRRMSDHLEDMRKIAFKFINTQ